MIKAVLFDLDGVIADSEPIHELAESKILRDLGSKHVGYDTGIRFEDLLEKASTELGMDIDIKKMMDKKFEVMIKNSSSMLPIKNSVQLIDSLSGMKRAVVSGSTRDWVAFSLQKFGLEKKFDAVVASEDCKNGKPDPEPYAKAAKMLGFPLSECIAIEDSTAGIKSAKSAGMTCVGYVSANSHNQDLSAADHVVQDLMDVKRFL